MPESAVSRDGAWSTPLLSESAKGSSPGSEAIDSGNDYLALRDEEERHIPWEDWVRTGQPCFSWRQCWADIATAIYVSWVEERDIVCSIIENLDPNTNPDFMQVVLDVKLDTDGYLAQSDVSIIQSSGSNELDQSSIAAVKRSLPFDEMRGLNTSEYRNLFKNGYVVLDLDGFRCQTDNTE